MDATFACDSTRMAAPRPLPMPLRIPGECSQTSGPPGTSLSHELAHGGKFVRVDRVAHPLVDPLVYACAHPSKHFRRLVHALQRDMWINIAASEKHRCVSHRTWIIARRAGRTDHAAAERNDGRVALRVSGGELQSEASALRESENDDVFGRVPGASDLRDQARDHTERGCQPRLVLRNRRQK